MAKIILDSIPQDIMECPGRLGIKTGSKAGQFVCNFTGKECNCCGENFDKCPAFTVINCI